MVGAGGLHDSEPGVCPARGRELSDRDAAAGGRSLLFDRGVPRSRSRLPASSTRSSTRPPTPTTSKRWSACRSGISASRLRLPSRRARSRTRPAVRFTGTGGRTASTSSSGSSSRKRRQLRQGRSGARQDRPSARDTTLGPGQPTAAPDRPRKAVAALDRGASRCTRRARMPPQHGQIGPAWTSLHFRRLVGETGLELRPPGPEEGRTIAGRPIPRVHWGLGVLSAWFWPLSVFNWHPSVRHIHLTRIRRRPERSALAEPNGLRP